MQKLKFVWNKLLQNFMFSDASVHNAAGIGEQQLSSTLNAIPDLMFELDEEGRHWDFRALRPELLVAPAEVLMGRTVSDVMPEEAAAAVMLALNETRLKGFSNGTQIQLPTPVGVRWFEVSMARKEHFNGEEPRFIALSRDITERKKQYLKAESLAYTDALTGLSNRVLFEERLEIAIRSCEATGLYAAVMFIDLDYFKQLNDSMGHDVGDQLLKQFAQRLSSSVRSQDLVARWGGDEFIVMIETLGHDRSGAEEQIKHICAQLIDKMRMPYDLDDHQHQCHVSIGVRLFKGDDGDLSAILKEADKAMYSAKQVSSSHYAFNNRYSESRYSGSGS